MSRNVENVIKVSEEVHQIASSSSRNEYYQGGIVAFLLQDHRTVRLSQC